MVNKYAIIEGGEVANIVLAEEPLAENWVDAAGAQIGYSWNGESFIAPVVTPEEALADERAGMVCSRAQGKMAIGPDIWANVVALAEDPETPWALRCAIYDTNEWRRLDPDMDGLIWAMGLTDAEADDLFRLAMTL